MRLVPCKVQSQFGPSRYHSVALVGKAVGECTPAVFKPPPAICCCFSQYAPVKTVSFCRKEHLFGRKRSFPQREQIVQQEPCSLQSILGGSTKTHELSSTEIQK